MYTKLLRRGEKACQVMCPRGGSRPGIRCFTSRWGQNVRLCPSGCCRHESSCKQMA